MAALVMHYNFPHSPHFYDLVNLYNEDNRIYMIDVDKSMNYLSIRQM